MLEILGKIKLTNKIIILLISTNLPWIPDKLIIILVFLNIFIKIKNVKKIMLLKRLIITLTKKIAIVVLYLPKISKLLIKVKVKK